eukprot:15581-Eustigmatos_ZCMA.PRE.1
MNKQIDSLRSSDGGCSCDPNCGDRDLILCYSDTLDEGISCPSTPPPSREQHIPWVWDICFPLPPHPQHDRIASRPIA